MQLNATHSIAPTGALAGLASRMEQAGCDGFYLAELTHDPFPGIAVAATGSTRLQYGTSIALAFTRSPTTMAYTAHDLMAATDGRFVLGLGPQVRPHIERRFGLDWTPPAQRMKDYVLAMRAVWEAFATGESLAFESENYTLSLLPPAFRPEEHGFGPPPVYLAAVGPKMAEVAGEVADGLFIHAFATPRYVREVLVPAVERGLARSGRSRTDFRFGFSAFTADTSAAPSEAEAFAQARNSVAFYASTPDYRRVLDLHGIGDLQPRLRAMTRAGEWDRMAGEISDEVLDLFCIAGGPERIADEIGRRWGGLADEVSLTCDFWLRHAGNAGWRAGAERLRAIG